MEGATEVRTPHSTPQADDRLHTNNPCVLESVKVWYNETLADLMENARPLIK